MTAVLPLPGTDEFQQFVDEVRTGWIAFRVHDDGEKLMWDLNSDPHILATGMSGGGDALDEAAILAAFTVAALCNPDDFELYLCDPNEADFTWAKDFPNVTRYATTDEEIQAAIHAARQEVDRRLDLIDRTGVNDFVELCEKFQNTPELVEQFGPAPRRLILNFPSFGDWLSQHPERVDKAFTDDSSDEKTIAMNGRKTGVHFMTALVFRQSENSLSRQFRSRLWMTNCPGAVWEFPLGNGRVEEYAASHIWVPGAMEIIHSNLQKRGYEAQWTCTRSADEQ